MTPEQIRSKLNDIIYNLLDMQGYMPTGELNNELRQVRADVVELQLKVTEYACDNKNKLI